jgi:DNA-binding MarR family transcriptional regulator
MRLEDNDPRARHVSTTALRRWLGAMPGGRRRRLAECQLRKDAAQTRERALRDVYDALDINSNGHVTVKEVLFWLENERGWRHFGETSTNHRAGLRVEAKKKIVDRLDDNNDGTVSFKSFRAVFGGWSVRELREISEDQRYLKVLAEAMQAFERLNRAQLRPLGLTLAQFDILATLGDTRGMTFRELGEHTLITKGTLTGVVDRMAALGWVERVPGEGDRRTTLVRLTARGQRFYREVFPGVVAGSGPAFANLGDADRRVLDGLLESLRDGFEVTAASIARGSGAGTGRGDAAAEAA